DRKDDVPLLVRHFLDKIVAQSMAEQEPNPSKAAAVRPQMTMSQEAMRRLMAYHWPGNVRQLENAIERAMAFAAGRSQIEVGDLPPEVQDAREVSLSAAVAPDMPLPEHGMSLDAFMSGIERDLIQRTLVRTGGNKGQAARL